jgi:hypothetical protein
MSTWDYFFFYGSIFSPLIPIALLFNKKYDGPIRLLVIVSFTSDIVSAFLIRGNNHIFLAWYGLVEMLILFSFYYKVLNTKKWIPYLTIAFSTFYLVNSFYLVNDAFNSISRSAECLIMIFLILKLFHQFFKQEEDIFIEQSPLFWVNVGLLIYFSGAFFTFIFSEYILDPREVPLWRLHNSANFLKNILIAIGLWKVRTR